MGYICSTRILRQIIEMYAGQQSVSYGGLENLSKEISATSQAASTKGCSQEDEPRTRYITENGEGYLTSGKGATLC